MQTVNLDWEATNSLCPPTWTFGVFLRFKRIIHFKVTPGVRES